MDKVFIFTGRSGVGKGTQVQMFQNFLKEKYPEQRVVYFEAGGNFRKFIVRPEHTAQLAKKIYEKGGLFPEFLAIYNWANFFTQEIRGDEFLIMDGSPRKLHEAEMLDTAFEFYKKEDVYIIFMDAPRDWSEKLLSERGRSDDTQESVKHRLDWFEEEVAATIEYYKKHEKHTFLEINADQTREKVHAEIISKLSL
ncbi:hypothetical protein CL630_00975 [bacterium]|nr:hypothetical protein [bacterium]|tara:strand:+ start:7044 stop:7631 length:588 start_codon:yes stop_codon:yes gene_type:complete